MKYLLMCYFSQLLNHPDVLSLYQYIENYSMPDKKLVQNIKNDGIGTINIFHENKNDTLQVLLHAGFGTELFPILDRIYETR